MHPRQVEFQERLGINEKQFTEVAAFFGIMSGKSGRLPILVRSRDWGISESDLLAIRQSALNSFISNAELLDREAKATGHLHETYIDENGVAVTSYTRTTRGAIHAMETGDLKTAAAIAGVASIDVIDATTLLFEQRLMFMAAEGLKLNPTFNALDLMRALPDPFHFSEWMHRAIAHLDVDHLDCENESGT